MRFNPSDFFERIEYLGEFESVRQIYYVYRKNHDFMLVTLSRNRLDSFNVNFVPEKCVRYLASKFKRKIVDRKGVESENTRIFGSRRERGFKILNTFYVLCVLGMAEKANEVEQGTMRFRIRGQWKA
jgi:hypothetical protein